MKFLSASPQNEPEQNSFDHLKRYIKSLGEVALKAFLQFTTGHLARHAMPMQGDTDEESNFTQLLKLRGKDQP